MNSLVTIIIPAYNAQKYITRCVESCFQQTYSFVEVIVINDGSTDNTVDLLKSYNDSRLKLITTRNYGAFQARNVGIEAAKGEFVLFLDSDDYLESTAVDILLSVECIDNSDVVVGQANIHTYSGRVFKTNYTIGDGLINSFLTGGLPVTLWPILYKRKVFNEIDCSIDLKVGEDFVLNALIITKGFKCSICGEVVYNYIKHQGGVTANLNADKLNDNYRAYLKVMELIEMESFSSKNEALKKYHFRYMISLFKINSPHARDVAIKAFNSKWFGNMRFLNESSFGCGLLMMYYYFPTFSGCLSCVCSKLYFRFR